MICCMIVRPCRSDRQISIPAMGKNLLAGPGVRANSLHRREADVRTFDGEPKQRSIASEAKAPRT